MKKRVLILMPVVMAIAAVVYFWVHDHVAAEFEVAATTSTAVLPAATSPTTTVPPPSPAETILESMTLTDKASQVLWVGFAGKSLASGTADVLIDYGRVGGLILLPQNIGGPQTLKALTSDIQERAREVGQPLQLFVGIDQEGGVIRITADMPRVPWARTLGEDSTPVHAGELAANTAEGLLSCGVNLNLAPVADVAPADSYMGKRSYSDDPGVVSEFVGAVVEGYESQGLVSVIKHFPGHGSTDGNTHNGAVVAEAGTDVFAAVHLPPFQAGIAAGAEGVMLSHITATAYDPGNPTSRSPTLIHLLRDEWGYEGLIVTDSVCMMAAQSGIGVEEAAVASLRAGCDVCIVMATAGKELSVRNEIVKAVEDGRLSAERLDEAVLRVIEVKLRHGMTNVDLL